MNELYDIVNGLRPKLTFHLTIWIRKKVGTQFSYLLYVVHLNILLDLLQEMRNKLSHVVKLYDQLLTEQLANSRAGAGELHLLADILCDKALPLLMHAPLPYFLSRVPQRPTHNLS